MMHRSIVHFMLFQLLWRGLGLDRGGGDGIGKWNGYVQLNFQIQTFHESSCIYFFPHALQPTLIEADGSCCKH